MPKRKIPARKHHGVRDPLRQRAQQYAKIKDKINNPPEKGGTQKVSRKLAELMKVKEDVKTGKFIKLKKTCNNEDKPRKDKGVRNIKSIRPIKQFAGEDDDDYLRRVNRITSESLKEAEYEAKYGVDIIKDPKTGKISIQKKPKNELDELISKRRRKSKVGSVKEHKIDPKLSKELIKQVLQEEKAKKKEELVEFKRDEVKFGEVVHAPPNISTLPRRAQKSDTVPRPGKKDNLLLRGLLNSSNENKGENVTKPEKVKKLAVGTDLKGKRRDLPMGTRRMLEDQQSKAIEMYRQLKKAKLKPQT